MRDLDFYDFGTKSAELILEHLPSGWPGKCMSEAIQLAIESGKRSDVLEQFNEAFSFLPDVVPSNKRDDFLDGVIDRATVALCA